MFRFEHTEFLFLLLIVPLLIGIHIYARMRRKRNLKQFGNPALLAELMPNVSNIRPQIKFYLQIAAISGRLARKKAIADEPLYFLPMAKITKTMRLERQNSRKIKESRFR
jgi:hypothetical protein